MMRKMASAVPAYADGTNHRLLPQLCPGLCEVLLYHIDIYD